MNEEEKNARFQHFRRKKQEKIKEEENRPGLKVVKALPPLSNKPIIIASKTEILSPPVGSEPETLDFPEKGEMKRDESAGKTLGEKEMRPVITQQLKIKIKRSVEAERLVRCANEK